MFKSLATGAIGVRADLARAAELASRYGFQAVHVSIDEIAQLGVERAQTILTRAGVRAAAFSLPLDYRAPQPQFAERLERLPALCQAAQAMGLTRTSTWVPSWHDAMGFSENYAFHRQRLGQIAAVLKDHGIRLGLEFLGPKTLRDGHEFAFIHTMEGMLELCRDLGTGNVGLLLDAYHWYTSGGALADLQALTDADVVDVHVNDAAAGVARDEQLDQVRALPGETGVIDLVGFLQSLQSIGYSGPVMVEPFSQRVNALPPEEAVRVTAEALDAVWKRAGLP
ncbi:MAG: sugar phosphate isomerase/epimerase family protein [Anaerolineae bacterium]|nr:sugar phosphate isomerase/epimerase family protein [Anaerolineae bacterium]